MPKKGGQTTFSGTKYQAEVTALYLGRLLDLCPRGDDQMVVYVRPECDVEAAVDDILVRFKDGHTEWFQVKENIADSGETWRKMWGHFEDQLLRIKKDEDRIVLILGYSQTWSNDLKELCQRAKYAKDSEEWLKEGELSKKHLTLIDKVKKDLWSLFSVKLEYHANLNAGDISEDFRQEFENHGIALSHDLTIETQLEGNTWLIIDDGKGQTYIVRKEAKALNTYVLGKAYREDLYELMRRVDLRVIDADRVREDYGPVWMPVSNYKPLDLYDKILRGVFDTAEKGKSIERDWLLQELENEQVDIGATYLLGGIKTNWTVPFRSLGEGFFGRQADMEKLHALLIEHDKVGITGMGGLGKTLLSAEYAYHHKDEYLDGVFWLNAAKPLLQEFADLAVEVGLAELETASDVAAFSVRDYLADKPQALVVFDNLNKPKDLNQPIAPGLIPSQLGVRILFTTRQREFPNDMQPLEIKVLSEQAALRLLLQGRPEVLEQAHPENPAAIQIVNALGGLPLPLKITSAYLSKFKSKTTLNGYLKMLETRGKFEALDLSVEYSKLSEEDLSTRHSVAMKGTLATQWQELDDPDARQLFVAAGQLPQASWIPIERLGLLSAIPSYSDDGMEVSLLDLALEELISVSLVEELIGERLSLHPLVHEYAATKGSPCLPLELATNLANALSDMVSLENQVARRGIDVVLEDLHAGLIVLVGQMGGGTSQSQLYRLKRVMDREAHHLRNWEPDIRPYFFLQQLAWRAHAQREEQLAVAAEGRLQALDLPYVRWLWGSLWESPELLRILKGHSLGVVALALTRDGQQVISTSSDRTLRVWDLESGETTKVLEGHADDVVAVSITCDGRWAISASHDRTLRVWDLENRETIKVLEGHQGGVFDVAITEDEHRAVSASQDRTLRVWDLESGQTLKLLEGHTDWVVAVALTRDGHRAISASHDRTLRVWDLESGQTLQILEGHTDWVTDVVITIDGRKAVSAAFDGTTRVWDLQSGETIKVLEGHQGKIFGIALTEDGRWAISASQDRTLRVWDLESGETIKVLKGHTDDVVAVSITCDGHRAISASQDRTLRVWDLESGETVKDLESHQGKIYNLALTEDWRQAISASQDRTLRVWDLESGETIKVLKGHTDDVVAVSITSDGRRAISASHDRKLRVWDLENQKTIQILEGHDGRVFTVSLTQDELQAVSASEDGTLRVWLLESGKVTKILKGHSDSVEAVALTKDGRQAVSASHDSTIRVWDLKSGRTLKILVGHEYLVHSVTLTNNNCLAVSASLDGTARLWDLESGQVLQILEGHKGAVTGLALTEDDQRVVSASYDKTLCVWDLVSGETINLVGHTGWVESVDLMKDGCWAVSGSKDGTVRVWDLESGGAIIRFDEESITAIKVFGPYIIVGNIGGSIYCLKIWEPGYIKTSIKTYRQAATSSSTFVSPIFNPYDLAIVSHYFDFYDVELKPPKLHVDDPIMDISSFEVYNTWERRLKFKILEAYGNNFVSEVSLDGKVIGIIRFDIDIASLDQVFWKVSEVMFKGDQEDIFNEAISLARRREWLEIWFESGHMISGGKIYDDHQIGVPFIDMVWANLKDYDVTKEKPTPILAVGEQDSLFDWMLRYWPNLDGSSSDPGGWLSLDDGAMEIADFIHFDDTIQPSVISFILVKGSGRKDAERGIFVSDFVPVTSEALKNVQYLDRLIRGEGLDKGIGKQITNLVWHNRIQSTREDMIEVLSKVNSNYKIRVYVFQPSLTRKMWEWAMKNKKGSAYARLGQLNSHLLKLVSVCKGLGVEFKVIGENI